MDTVHRHKLTVEVHELSSGPPLDDHLGAIKRLLKGLALGKTADLSITDEKVAARLCTTTDKVETKELLDQLLSGFKIIVVDNPEEGDCHECTCAA